MFQITDAARDKIRTALESNQGKFLRVYISGAG